jgi:hypothetical protein
VEPTTALMPFEITGSWCIEIRRANTVMRPYAGFEYRT